MEKNKGAMGIGKKVQSHDVTALPPPTYKDLGIEKTRQLEAPQEIAAHPDITVKTHQAISEIAKKLGTQQICNHFYISHKEADKIAEMFDIDEQTAWAILLEGQDDEELESALQS